MTEEGIPTFRLQAASVITLFGIFLCAGNVTMAEQQMTAATDVTAASGSGMPQSCPVTKPYQTSLFVPPSPYTAKAPAGSFWFGSDRLRLSP